MDVGQFKEDVRTWRIDVDGMVELVVTLAQKSQRAELRGRIKTSDKVAQAAEPPSLQNTPAAEALPAKLADADQHFDVDRELLPDVKEHVDAVAAVKLRVGRQP